RIHHSRFVIDAINNRGYKPLFMPLYSPFLNPIQECWSNIKKLIRRNPLDKTGTITPRITEVCSQSTVPYFIHILPKLLISSPVLTARHSVAATTLSS
ncbi:hypothetical protein K501DRAFT_200505, partial [Backusella circina FSU 941]